MAHSERGDWRELAPQLSALGYATLAIDLRGHGKSGGELAWNRMADDVRLALEYLKSCPDIDPGRIALLGASLGANLALNAAADDPTVRGAALLSPGLDYFGVRTRAALESYGDRPLFIAASEDDEYAARSSQELAELAAGETRFELYRSAGHGAGMLQGAPELPEQLLGWFETLLD
jgi:pimeloyl-ACP methyl ester carboxylesterase